MTDTRVVTLLFTDLADSTALSQRVGADAADALRRAHFQLLRDALADSATGKQVKNLGDGIMAVFDSPSDAIACSVAMQRAVQRHNRRPSAEPLGLRIGIHVGEVALEADDYFGIAVVVADRLCKAADPGQIVVSGAVRMLASGRGGHGYLDLGARDLKGLAEPVGTFAVPWEQTVDATPASISRGNLALVVAREVAAHATVAMFVVDADGTLVFYNEAAEEILGRRYKDAGALRLEQWVSAFNPDTDDGRPIAADSMPLSVALVRRQASSMTMRIREIGGTRKAISVMAFPLLAGDECAGAVAIFWTEP